MGWAQAGWGLTAERFPAGILTRLLPGEGGAAAPTLTRERMRGSGIADAVEASGGVGRGIGESGFGVVVEVGGDGEPFLKVGGSFEDVRESTESLERYLPGWVGAW